MNQSTNFT